MRRVVAKQSGQDEVARGHGFGSLGKKQDEGGLLLSQACLPFPELHGSPRRVELEPAETIAAGTAGAALDQACGQVGVDVGYRDVALDEIRARSELVSAPDRCRVDLRGRKHD